MMSLESVLSVFSFAMGAVIASFLNVVIWRVPRGESIVRPGSHCPKCGAAIAWYQNIPILSWLALRGRCANCRAPISPRYVLVETLGGLLFLAAFWRYGLYAPVMWIWLSLMIAGSFIDFDHLLLPDFVTIGGMVFGLLLNAAESVLVYLNRPASSFLSYPIVSSVIGLAFGFGLLYLVRVFGSKAFKREAMGLGDVFLMGAIGAIFGPIAVLVTLILSSIIGSVIGISLILIRKVRMGKMTEIPFGPYLCLGCLAWMFYGPEIVRLYLSLILRS